MDSNIVKKIKSAYDNIADKFSGTRKYNWRGTEKLVKFVTSGDKVLDLGCGNGRLYQLLEDKSINYVGLDISSELIKLAQSNYSKFSNIRFVVGDMSQDLPFANNQFDVVFMLASFHHLPSSQSRINLLNELRRVVKPGSKLIMTNWNLAHPKFVKRYDLDLGQKDFQIPWKNSQGEILESRYYHLFDKAELRNLFTETGWSVKDQFYFDEKGQKVEIDKGVNLISIVSNN